MRWIVLVTFVIGFLLGIGLGPGTPEASASRQADPPSPTGPAGALPAVTRAAGSGTDAL